MEGLTKFCLWYAQLVYNGMNQSLSLRNSNLEFKHPFTDAASRFSFGSFYQNIPVFFTKSRQRQNRQKSLTDCMDIWCGYYIDSSHNLKGYPRLRMCRDSNHGLIWFCNAQKHGGFYPLNFSITDYHKCHTNHH